jgi:hypothetical protein
LFIQQDYRRNYVWCCTDDFMEIVDDESLARLQQKALEIYETTFIKKFRDSPIDEHPDIPSLSDSILDQLKLFRENPDCRTEYVKRIIQSPLGSRRQGLSDVADSGIQSTTKSPIQDITRLKIVFPTASSAGPIYLSPEMPLSRSQALFLFGAPSVKQGLWYYWICDKNPAPGEGGDLIVCFNEQMKSRQVYYDKYQKYP